MRLLALVLACLLTAPGAFATDVWLDVDVATGMPNRDVDDGLAMIQAFNSPELTIRGVSAVFGNSPLDKGVPIAREIVAKFGPKGVYVHPGAASLDDFGKVTDAVRAMAVSLRAKPMHILALGPVTNVGTLVQKHPELHDRIESIVMVAARRPGQRFTYPEHTGPPFRDFNFENDPAAMKAILETDIPLVFAPWEVSSHVWLTQKDLDWLAKEGGSGVWITEKSLGWLEMWETRLNLHGFNPFDTLAIGWMTHPELIQGMKVIARIEEGPDDTVQTGAPRTKPYLLVEPTTDHRRRIVYTFRPAEQFKSILLQRLAGPVE